MCPLPRPKMRPLPARIAAEVPVSDLPNHIANYLLECKVNGYSSATIANRKLLLSKLLWYMQEHERAVMDEISLTAFFAYLRDTPQRWGNTTSIRPLKPASLLTYHTRYATFCQWLVKESVVSMSPMAKMEPPIHRADQIQPFTLTQIQAMLHVAEQSCQPERNRALIYVFLDSGARVSEVCALNWADIDFQAEQTTLRVVGKGNKARTVYLGRVATRHLLAYAKVLSKDDREPHCPVFLSWCPSGERITRDGVQKLIARMGRAAGITNVRCSPHTFRHTFAIEFLRGRQGEPGGTTFALQELLGHEDLKTVRRYVQLAQADMMSQHKRHSPGDRLGRK